MLTHWPTLLYFFLFHRPEHHAEPANGYTNDLWHLEQYPHQWVSQYWIMGKCDSLPILRGIVFNFFSFLFLKCVTLIYSEFWVLTFLWFSLRSEMHLPMILFHPRVTSVPSKRLTLGLWVASLCLWPLLLNTSSSLWFVSRVISLCKCSFYLFLERLFRI